MASDAAQSDEGLFARTIIGQRRLLICSTTTSRANQVTSHQPTFDNALPVLTKQCWHARSRLDSCGCHKPIAKPSGCDALAQVCERWTRQFALHARKRVTMTACATPLRNGFAALRNKSFYADRQWCFADDVFESPRWKRFTREGLSFPPKLDSRRSVGQRTKLNLDSGKP